MVTLVLLGILWYMFLCVTVISSGYHLYYSHDTYTAPIWYQHFVNIFGPLTGAGPVIDWSLAHIAHHRNSDTEGDPHSPAHIGIINALICNYNSNIKTPFTRKFINNKMLRTYKQFHLIHLFVIVVVIFGLFGSNGLIILFIIPYVLGRFGLGLLNIFGHLYGEPRNTIIGNVVTGFSGEGYHKYHHENLHSYSLGKYSLSKYFIEAIKIND